MQFFSIKNGIVGYFAISNTVVYPNLWHYTIPQHMANIVIKMMSGFFLQIQSDILSSVLALKRRTPTCRCLSESDTKNLHRNMLS